MSEYFRFHDVSYSQGSYNMTLDKNPVIAMKMSGFYYGSKTGYLDSQAANNYHNAIKTGKLPMLYHFAGGGNPTTEADYFIAAVAPFAKGDVYVLDYELTAQMKPPKDPVAWCLAYVERVHARTGVFPIFYTYAAMLRAYNWSPVLALCGLWVADYATPPGGTVNTNGHPYIMHQFTDKPLDTSACYIPLATLKKYAYGYGGTATKVIADITPKETHVTTTTTLPTAPSPGTVVSPTSKEPSTITITDIKPGVSGGTAESASTTGSDTIPVKVESPAGQAAEQAPLDEEDLERVTWLTKVEVFFRDLFKGV